MAVGRRNARTLPSGGVIGQLPFDGLWLTEVSPSRRIPSHGTHRFATTYAIDFTAVDDAGHTGPRRRLRSITSTEPPEIFHAFGLPIYSPVEGTVVGVHDGEPDHEAARSLLTLIPYAMGQSKRIGRGFTGVAGNYVIVRDAATGFYIGLAHLRSGSIRVRPGGSLKAGERVGDCGNSGNSTQPHLHIQAMDGQDPLAARGIPLRFEEFYQRPRPSTAPVRRRAACPVQGAFVSRE